MLWYKAWLETRWRFLIGLAILLCSGAGIVFTYPKVVQLMTLVPAMDVGGEIGRKIREAAELSREYRGYIWSQWFRQNLAQTGTLFAVLLGSGGLLSQGSGGAALFTLSLPISRHRIVGVRAMTGLAEFLAIALASSLVVPLLSPGVGQSYSVASALVHAFCFFIAGTTFFSLALLLSTVFADLWRPLLIALAIAMVLALVEAAAGDPARYGVYRVMSAEDYFRSGRLPWLGLGASAAATLAMLYGAATNIARHDF